MNEDVLGEKSVVGNNGPEGSGSKSPAGWEAGCLEETRSPTAKGGEEPSWKGAWSEKVEEAQGSQGGFHYGAYSGAMEEWILRGLDPSTGGRDLSGTIGGAGRGFALGDIGAGGWHCVEFLEINKIGVLIRLDPRGTTSEEILKFHTSGRRHLTIHRCDPDCDGKETSQGYVHARRAHLVLDPKKEEDWTTNLVQAGKPIEEMDELKSLRREAGLLGTKAAVAPEEERESKRKKSSSSSSSKGKKKSSSKVKKAKKKDRSKSPKQSTQQLAVKKPGKFFKGTGLDFKEKVRLKIRNKAQKFVKAKGKDRGASSSSTSASGSTEEIAGLHTSELFGASMKAKQVAEIYPGVLAAEGLSAMRTGLLHEAGQVDEKSVIMPLALQYYRNHLARKMSGAQSREALTLCTAIDLMLRGRAAAAMDLMVQRVKSVESIANGSHYTVAQRLELVPQESHLLTGREEMRSAARESYQDSRTKWLSSLPDGRNTKGKGKEGGKNADGKGGKGKNPEKGGDDKKRK